MSALSDFAAFPNDLRALVNNAVPAMAYVRRISDGDTIVVYLDRRFHDGSIKRIRLRGVNAAELKTLEGQKARNVLAGLLQIGEAVVVTTFKLTYDRYEGEVKFLLRGKVRDLAEVLVERGTVVRVRAKSKPRRKVKT